MSVSDLEPSDIGADLMHIIHGSDVDVDGIFTGQTCTRRTRTVSPAGESALLVTFTDQEGRNRIAEVTITALARRAASTCTPKPVSWARNAGSAAPWSRAPDADS